MIDLVPDTELFLRWLWGGSLQLLLGAALIWTGVRFGWLRGDSACLAILFVLALAAFPEGLLPSRQLEEYGVGNASSTSDDGGLGSAYSSRSEDPVEAWAWVLAKDQGSWLVPLWFGVGATLGAGALIRMLHQCRALVRRSACLDARALEILEEVKRELGLFVPVSLYESEDIGSPALYGLLRPRIFFPTGLLADLDDRTLREVLAHECAHIRRLDIGRHWLLLVLASPFWFHPATWVLLPLFLREREVACDRSVLRTGEPDPGSLSLIHI